MNLNKTSNIKTESSFFKGLKDGVPVALGYIPIALACGIATSKVGLSFFLSQFMSMLIYSGAGQAAATNLIRGGETAIIMYALTIFVTNCRYILLSMSLAQKLDPSMNSLQRTLIGIFNTDEVFGVAMKEKGDIKASYFFGLTTLPYIAFAFGNALGSFTTDLLPHSLSSALGIMIYAMFIAIIIPPAKESKPILIVLLMALALSIVLECIPAVTQNLTPGWIIIICAVVTASVCAILFPVESAEEKEEL